MLYLRPLFFILLSIVLLTPLSIIAESISIHAGIPSVINHIKNYKEITKNKTCNNITSYTDPKMSRGIVEGILICQALRIGGLEPTFVFKGINTYTRSIAQVNEGRITLMFDSAWLQDANPDKVYISDPVINIGEFEVGIFTRTGHKEVLKVTSVEQLQKFTVVSNRNWVIDWLTLESMKVKKFSVPTAIQMHEMVYYGRVDYMLAAFSSLSDMSQIVNGLKLIPVPGIKIGLKGSRHILINKHHPDSKKIFNALQIGLKTLRHQGLITKAYQESGFYNENVKNWKLLCCK